MKIRDNYLYFVGNAKQGLPFKNGALGNNNHFSFLMRFDINDPDLNTCWKPESDLQNITLGTLTQLTLNS